MPAITFNPSDNIAFANCLASLSVGNDSVFLGTGARDGAIDAATNGRKCVRRGSSVVLASLAQSPEVVTGLMKSYRQQRAEGVTFAGLSRSG